MHLEAHAGLGWAIGVLAPGSDRRLRALCQQAELISDIDAVTYLVSFESYGYWHHTFGHGVLFGLLIALAALALLPGAAKRRGLGAAIVVLAFASHLLTDAIFTRYPIFWAWPLSRSGFLFDTGIGLVAPVNAWLVYAAIALVPVPAAVKKVTLLELLSPRLDRIVLRFFRRREWECSVCRRPCNLRCDGCGRAGCLKHGAVDRRFVIARGGCGEARRGDKS